MLIVQSESFYIYICRIIIAVHPQEDTKYINNYLNQRQI